MKLHTLATRPMAARCGLTLAALFIAGAAVGLLKFAGLGTDPYNAMAFGISGTFRIPYPILYGALTIAIAIAVFFLDKRYIGFTTVANFFVPGTSAQLVLDLCALLPIGGLMIRLAALAVGLVVLCVAVSMMIVCDLGLCSYDAVALIIEKRTPLSYRVCRIITDAFCVAAGFALSAPIGVTTLIAVTSMGPIINWGRLRVSQPLLDRAAGRKRQTEAA